MNTTRISYGCALALAVACSEPGPAPERELVVFGAASLHEAFDALGQELQATHHGVQVHATYAGSQALRAQIEQGASADVVAAAAAEELAPLIAARRLGELKLFAHNELVIAKPKGAAAPAQLRDLATLARIVIGAPEVPVGRYAQRMLERANGRYGADFSQRVRSAVVSQEASTRLVLAKVSLGEANAGIVYRTDARAAAKTVDTVEIPAELNERAEYVIAELRDSPHPTLARAFVELARSPRGQAVLARFGFLPARDGSEPSRSIADEGRLGADP
jgi:molybdate transport system substrate-binding protein